MWNVKEQENPITEYMFYNYYNICVKGVIENPNHEYMAH